MSILICSSNEITSWWSRKFSFMSDRRRSLSLVIPLRVFSRLACRSGGPLAMRATTSSTVTPLLSSMDGARGGGSDKGRPGTLPGCPLSSSERKAALLFLSSVVMTDKSPTDFVLGTSGGVLLEAKVAVVLLVSTEVTVFVRSADAPLFLESSMLLTLIMVSSRNFFLRPSVSSFTVVGLSWRLISGWKVIESSSSPVLLKAPALRSVNSAIVFLRLALLAAFLAWRNMGSLTLSMLVTLDLSTVGELLGAGTFRELGRDEMEALLGSTSGSRDGYDCRAGAPSGRSSSSPPEGGGFFMGFSKTIMSGVEVWKAPLSPVALSWSNLAVSLTIEALLAVILALARLLSLIMACLSEFGGGGAPGAKGTEAGLRDSFRVSPFFIQLVGEFDIFSVAVRGGTREFRGRVLGRVGIGEGQRLRRGRRTAKDLRPVARHRRVAGETGAQERAR
mmetsp:Transcript_5945/g.11257  ORF Transcript_5945/g.11257 Transcript_5945/m.11257 type:complete len:448 (-) Transcript_5945:67-1410(-)